MKYIFMKKESVTGLAPEEIGIFDKNDVLYLIYTNANDNSISIDLYMTLKNCKCETVFLEMEKSTMLLQMAFMAGQLVNKGQVILVTDKTCFDGLVNLSSEIRIVADSKQLKKTYLALASTKTRTKRSRQPKQGKATKISKEISQEAGQEATESDVSVLDVVQADSTADAVPDTTPDAGPAAKKPPRESKKQTAKIASTEGKTEEKVAECVPTRRKPKTRLASASKDSPAPPVRTPMEPKEGFMPLPEEPTEDCTLENGALKENTSKKIAAKDTATDFSVSGKAKTDIRNFLFLKGQQAGTSIITSEQKIIQAVKLSVKNKTSFEDELEKLVPKPKVRMIMQVLNGHVEELKKLCR